MTPEVLACLKELATGFTESDLAGLRLRWQFGRELLPLRVGKKLPKAELARIEEEVGVPRREIQHHLKFATRYPTDADCETAITQYPSWTRLVHLGLYKQTPKDATEDKKASARRRRFERLQQNINDLNPEDVPDARAFAEYLKDQSDRFMDAARQPKKAA